MPRKRNHVRRVSRGNPRGTLSVRPGGFGFVQTAEGEFFIPESKMNGAFDGDLVECSLLPRDRSKRYPAAAHSSDVAFDDSRSSDVDSGYLRRDGRSGSQSRAKTEKPVARIIRVVQRAHETIVGRYEIAEPFGVVIPEDPRINYDIFTRIEDYPGIADGSIVSVRISAFPTRNSAATGVIEEILGDDNDERIPIDLIVARHKLETSFSSASLDQAKSASLDEIGARAAGYRDLTDRFIFTVDPEDAKDFDDAVSIEPVDGWGMHKQVVWRLGVHIADVGHYVEWASSIDLDARRRATSVYLVDRVIPMLPEELSNDLCSLKPHVTRRTMTVDMYLDDCGRVIASEIYPALIRSSARLTYAQALMLLNFERMSKGEVASGPEIDFSTFPVDVSALSEDLSRRIYDVSAIAKKRDTMRREAGGIDFDTVEARVRLDDDGAPVDIDLRCKDDATQMIEESMILANETVARYLRDRDFPCVFRVHEQPDPENLEGLAAVFGEFSWFKDVSQSSFLSGDSHAIAQAVEAAKGHPESDMVTTLVLRSMKRAMYDPSCEGHYGLASEAYCHFTSPIRRYPDLVVHRMLKAALGKRPEKFDQEVSSLPRISEHSSEMERIAEAAARESQEAKIVELMEEHVGESFSATISGVASFGLFVRLDNTAEGMVRIEDLGREYFLLDSVRHRLVGTDTGKEFKLGQRIDVVLASAQRRTRRLDFRLAKKRKVRGKAKSGRK